MSLEENKALVRRFLENVWNHGKLELFDDYVAPDFVVHKLRVTPYSPDREGYRQWVADNLKSTPDIHITIEEMVAEGDLVMYRFTATGTNTGPGIDFPATGKKIKVPGYTTLRIRNGKQIEGWIVQDYLLMMQQLGFIPVSGGQPATV